MNDIKMEAEYRGYSIKWYDRSMDFKISDDGTEVKTGVGNLEECRSWIDGRLKQKFNRVNVLSRGWRGEVKRGVATSLIPEGGDRYYVWFTDSKKSRSKENIDSIYIDNEVNQTLLNKMASRQSQIIVLEKEIKEAVSQMENLTPAMMVGEKG